MDDFSMVLFHSYSVHAHTGHDTRHIQMYSDNGFYGILPFDAMLYPETPAMI